MNTDLLCAIAFLVAGFYFGMWWKERFR